MTVSPRQLAAQLQSEEVAARRAAAAALARQGPTAHPAAVELVEAAGDADEGVREWAVAALEDLGPPQEADLAALADLLIDTTADSAYWAATLLGRAGAAAASVVGSLEKALSLRQETAVRERIVWAVGHIGPRAASATGSLEAVARDAACPPRLARLCRHARARID